MDRLWLRIRVLVAVVLGLGCTAASAQTYRGEAIPLVQRVDPVEFLRLRFLMLTFGREGPMDAPVSTPPVAGREYLVEADISGIESAATIRFELAELAGRPVQTVTMWKSSDGASDGEFYGFITPPNRPFRVAAGGTSRSGGPFRSVLETVFTPRPTGPIEQIALPPGIPQGQTTRIQAMVDSYGRELKERGTRAAADHPGGVITLGRAMVSRISYEPFSSASGAPLGLRLRYSIQFPSRQTLVAMPHVFPQYPSPAWRGVVTMKVLGGSINPPPQMQGAQSLQDVLVYGGGATYEGGRTYTFTVDMVPDYVFQGTQSGRFCIHEQRFRDRTVWDALKASQAAIPYAVSISDTETAATIPAFFPQRDFYQSFVAAGATDCGPVPNVRF
jgi:hypothetical protein